VSQPRDKWLRRQQEIYDVAAHVFYEKGYEPTSIDDIADAVGLLKGSLYHYISSKEDLLHGIAQVVHRRMAEEIRTYEPGEGNALDHLCARFQRQTQGNLTDDDFLILIKIYYREFGSLTLEHQLEVVEARRAYEADTRDRIAMAQVEGSVCPVLDPDVIGPAILSLLNNLLRTHEPGAGDGAAVVARYVAFIRRGLSCPPEHDHRGRRVGARRNGSAARRKDARPVA
jgi:AcrR family transcriptional regulator